MHVAVVSQIEKTNMCAMKSLTNASQDIASQVPKRGANIDESGVSLVSQLKPCALMVAKRLCQPLEFFQGMLLRSTERILFTYEVMTVSVIGSQPKKHANTSYEASKHIESTFLRLLLLLVQAGSETGCKADFMVVKGVGRTLLGQEAALEIDILRISSVPANSVNGGVGSDICGRYRDLFNGVGL